MDFVSEFFAFYSPARFGLNALDYIIIGVFLFYALEGILIGFVAGIFDLLAFVLSFLLALRFYKVIGTFLFGTFSFPHGISDALGFFIIAFVFGIVLDVLFRIIFKKANAALSANIEMYEENALFAFLRRTNHVLGIIPGVLNALVILSFLFTLVVALPFSPLLTHAVTTSVLGNNLVSRTQQYETSLKDVFGEALTETMNFLTIAPDSEETISLNFKTTNAVVDEQSEQIMLQLLNIERTNRGLDPLEFDENLREVARKHSQDMLTRGYFSHYTPEGISPFDRMTAAGIFYSFAGENLAFAPTAEIAMQGLMQSKRHKENILSEEFGKVGIGVMDAGAYGKMFSQEFKD